MADNNGSFESALDAVSKQPEDEAAWDRLEGIAMVEKRIEEVAAFYRELLHRSLAPNLASWLAERAVAFHEEWIGDQSVIVALLERVLDADPTAQWAFDRISLQLTADGRWDELLALYDRVIARTEDVERRSALLEEVAHMAKDSAGKPERAVDYLSQVFALKPTNQMVGGALERLLRQQQRYPELIEFWKERLNHVRGDEALATYHNIAACWLENLNDPGGALAAVEPLLEDISTVEGACELLEKILVSPASNPSARRRALLLLSERYDRTNRWVDVVQALSQALQYVGLEERAEMHAEITRRLVDHGQTDQALEHLAALVALDEGSWPDAEVDRLLGGAFRGTVAESRPELTREQGQRVVRQAARLAAQEFEDPERAVALFRRVINEIPDDRESIRHLAKLYEAAERGADLLALRRHELKLAETVEQRLALRLEIARLLVAQGDTRGSVLTLRDSLEEQPDHEASIHALVEGLEHLADHISLQRFLCSQAEVVEGKRPQLAADLWKKAAQISENQLRDLGRALDCYRRVVALREEPDVLDALARIHGARKEHSVAVDWLVRRLNVAEPGARAETTIRLAEAYMGANQHDDAVRCLREGLEEDPTNLEMRELLAELYRRSRDWESLAAALRDGAELMPEESKRFALLSEAAQIFTDKLGAPERAISVLENARAISPEDRTVRTSLADALRAAGRLDEARKLAEELIEELGRRRVPEKALLHRMLAQIADARGDMDEALRQLEMAANVDVSNVQVQRMLGAAYRKVGQLQKAERAYHALLLILRRQSSLPKRGDVDNRVGVAEALYEIHRVAQDLGEPDRAKENLESAFDAANQNEEESRRLEAVLRENGPSELLMRALDQRLGFTTEPTARAELLADKASVLEERLGQSEQAFEALLEAVSAVPGAEEVQARAQALARRLGALDRYVDVLLRASRAAAEVPEIACGLLLRLGTLVETEFKDLDGAMEYYSRAESTGQRLPAVWRAQARVARAKRDNSAELSALRALSKLGAGDLPSTERKEVLYRLAELQAGFPDTLYDGLQTLQKALALGPDYPRAAAALRRGMELSPKDLQAVQMYEEVARNSSDQRLLLDALGRRCELGGVGQDLIREGYGIAIEIGEPGASESFLLRAIEVARDEVGDLAQSLWALRLLVARRKEAEQLDDAIHWMKEAADVAPADEARRLKLEIAAIASGKLNSLTLAADTYEALLDDNPGDPATWKPALEVVRRMGDRERFERLLTKVADAVTDPHARNQLRVAKARLLLTLPGRQEDAITTLRQVLADQIDHAVAAELLADQLERMGRQDELASLLEQQIDLACERGNRELGVKLTLRLGGMLASSKRDEALGAYRTILEWVPDDPRILDALVGLLKPDEDQQERADVLTRLVKHHAQRVLQGTGEPGRAMDLALTLVRARDQLGDPAGMEEALDFAFRIDPRHEQILNELKRLAERLSEEARQLENQEAAVELLQKAAAIYWNRLDDPGTAASILREAQALQPDNVTLIGKLVRCLIETGSPDLAVATVTEALDRHPEGDAQRIRLLKLRASVRNTTGSHGAAVSDLEEAMALGAEGLAQELCDVLRRATEAAAGAGDRGTERAMTMRMAEVLRTQLKDEAQAHALMSRWVAQNPLDRDAIHELLQIDSAAERWSDVAAGYARLIKLEEGEAQTDAAVSLADAYENAGTPEAAREQLEALYRLDQSDKRIRGRLRKLYERVEAYRDLSNLLLVEANLSEDEEERFTLLREAGEIRLTKLNAPATAVGPLVEALDLRPKDQALTLLLADSYIVAGFIDDALQLLQAAIARHGDRRSKDLASLQHRMAKAVATLDDPEAVLSWLVVAWESYPQSGELASELADHAMSMQSYDVALKALRALAAMRTPAPISRPLALFKQAQIAKAQGDERKAAFLAKKAQSEDPDLPGVDDFVQGLKA